MSAQQPNTVIRASAGTGKTHALTNRILALLLDGEEPERIIALTFNRTAAGEIFDTVIARLAAAAQSGAGAARLAHDLRGLRRTPGLDVETSRKTLRKLLLRLHLSHIGCRRPAKPCANGDNSASDINARASSSRFSTAS